MEAECAEVVYLIVYFLHHFGCENHVLAAALEEILSAQVCVLVENDLIHIEFVKVGIEKRNDDRFKFHSCMSFRYHFCRHGTC